MSDVCQNKGDRVDFCDGMKAAVEMPYGRGTHHQGFKQVSLVTKLATRNRQVRQAVVYIGGEWKSPGVFVLFCPFCGVDVQTDYQCDPALPPPPVDTADITGAPV